MGGYGNPPRKPVLQAAALYLDLLQLDKGQPPYCTTCTTPNLQSRVDAMTDGLGDRPWLAWEGWFANPDSTESGTIRADNIASTQAGRGAAYAAMVSLISSFTDSTYHSYHAVGYYWWDCYDTGEAGGLNWGLLTPTDNAYDAVEAVIATGTNSWGYSDGGEAANYGNFLGSVTTANQSVLTTLANEAVGTGGSNGVHGPGMW
jgi:hypothetical protein